MRFFYGCLLLLLLVSSLSPVHGILESPYTNFRCQCMKISTYIPRLKEVKEVKIFRPGNGCPAMEIIVWMKNKSTLCLDPKSKKTYRLLNLVQRSHGSLVKPTQAKKTQKP